MYCEQGAAVAFWERVSLCWNWVSFDLEAQLCQSAGTWDLELASSAASVGVELPWSGDSAFMLRVRGGKWACWFLCPYNGVSMKGNVHRHVPRMNNLPPFCPRWSSDLSLCLWLFACLLSMSRVAPAWLSQSHLQIFNLWFLKPHWLQKLSPSPFPCQWLWGYLLLEHSSVYPPLSLFSLWPWIPPFHSTHDPFLPQTTTLHSLPSSIGLFSFYLWNLFCQSSTQLHNIQNDLIDT